MIKVSYIQLNNHIKRILITGHALSDEYGKDLVCAAVSAIGFGGANAVDQAGGSAIVGENSIELKSTNNLCDDVLFTILTQLRTVEEKFKDNINIKEG